MPAAFWWDPISLDPDSNQYSAADAENWLMGDGAPWDRYAPSDPAPGPADDLFFGVGLSSASCLIPASLTASSGNAFHGVHLEFGWRSASRVGPPIWTAYSGTVTTADTFAVGTLEMQSGAISQGSISVPSGNGSTLTITSSLTWTGGTLNSNSVAGKIDLAPGASGVAEPSFTNPGINGEVTLGSTIALQGDPLTDVGSTLEMVSGTYHVIRGLITVGIQSVLTLAPVPKLSIEGEMAKVVLEKEIPESPDQQGFVQVGEKGSLIVRPKNRTPSTKNLPAEVVFSKGATLDNAGSVTLTDRARLIFDPDAGTTTYGYYQRQNFRAVTSVEAGCSFICKGQSYVNIDNGHLRLVERRLAGDITDTQPPILFEAVSTSNNPRAALRVSKHADIQRSDRADTVPVKVNVVGHFECEGAVEMFADRTLSGRSDVFNVTGRVLVGNDAKVTLWWLTSLAPTAGSDAEWELFKSTYSGNGDAISQKPAFELKDPDVWAVSVTDSLTDDKKVYRVKR